LGRSSAWPAGLLGLFYVSFLLTSVLFLRENSLARAAFEVATEVLGISGYGVARKLNQNPQLVQAPISSLVDLRLIVGIGSAGEVANLSLSATGPVQAKAGVNLNYSITVSNAGQNAATGVVVSNQLPANVTYVSATGGSTSINGVLLLNLGTLALGGVSNSIQIVVQPTLGFPAQSLGQPIGQLTNRFQVFANQTDSAPANGSATLVTTVVDAVPGTPIAWANPGGATVITYSTILVGAPSPIQVGDAVDPATNGQPGDFVLLVDPNGGTNSTNWAAVARFFNPSDPTGTNGLPATYSQVFFPTNFSGNSFRLFPDVSFIPEGTATTNNGFTSIVTFCKEYGLADAILAGQENIDVLTDRYHLSAKCNV
jgi:uncharacterized repeat protein (TIGR01451 family)